MKKRNDEKLKFTSIAFSVNFTHNSASISAPDQTMMIALMNFYLLNKLFTSRVHFNDQFEEKLSLRKLNKEEEVKKLVTKHKDINLSETEFDDELCRIFKITTQAAPHIESKATSREKFHFSKCGKSSHDCCSHIESHNSQHFYQKSLHKIELTPFSKKKIEPEIF